MKSALRAALLCFTLLASPQGFAAEAPPPAPMVELDKSDKARSKYKSLHKKLDQLRVQFEKGDGKRMIGTLKSARKELDSAASRSPSLDLSAEAAEIEAYTPIADALMAKAEANKIRDKALKAFDKEIVKLEKMVAQAERSKPRPDKFEKSLIKATDLLGAAGDADGSFDVTDRQAALDGLPESYAAAQVVYLQAGQFKQISKEITILMRAVDTIKNPKSANSFIERQIEKGESFWPEQVTTERNDVIAAFDAAKAETPHINLSAPEAKLAALDARIAELEPPYLQAGLDAYFAEQFDEATQITQTLSGRLSSGYATPVGDLQQYRNRMQKIGAQLSDSATSFSGSDLDPQQKAFDSLMAEFKVAAGSHVALANTNAYFEQTSGVLRPLATASFDSLAFTYREIFDSGIETLDVEALRTRLGETGGGTSAVRGAGVAEYVARIDSAIQGSDYVYGVKDTLKRTNDTSIALLERANGADAAERLALVAKRFAPDDPRYDVLIEQAKLRKAALLSEKNDRFASASTGGFHLDHMDSIVFHSAPLTIGSEDVSLVNDRFTAGETIYGTVYLSLPLREASLNREKPEIVTVRPAIDGQICQPYGTGRIADITREDGGKTAISFALLPSLDGYTFVNRNDSHVNFAKCQALNATVGEQEVVVELGLRDPNGDNEWAALQASFTLIYDTDAPARIAPIVATLEEMRIDAARLPEAVLEDEALESTLLEAANFVDGEPMRAVLSYKNWIVHKNDFDIPVDKELLGHFAVNTAEGRCFYYAAILLSPYTGGAYGPPRADRITQSKTEIRCGNVGE